MHDPLCPMLFFGAGVDGLIAIAHDGKAAGAFLGRGIDRFEKDLESNFLVLLNGFRESGFVGCETLLPSFSLKFFFSAHNKTPGQITR